MPRSPRRAPAAATRPPRRTAAKPPNDARVACPLAFLRLAKSVARRAPHMWGACGRASLRARRAPTRAAARRARNASCRSARVFSRGAEKRTRCFRKFAGEPPKFGARQPGPCVWGGLSRRALPTSHHPLARGGFVCWLDRVARLHPRPAPPGRYPGVFAAPSLRETAFLYHSSAIGSPC